MLYQKHQSRVLYFILPLFLTNVHCQQEVWAKLNQSLNGRLYIGTPLSLPCFSNYNGKFVQSDTVVCEKIQQNYASSTFRAQSYGGYTNSQDEICASNATDQCVLDNARPSNSQAYSNRSCSQGSVSPYYIEVQEPDDVVKAFQFSKDTRTRIVIKNSGHDYLGRSSLKGSLALWTRHLKALSRNSAFVTEGCSSGTTPRDTITVGAGVNFDEVYKYAEQQNVTFIGAYASTVGASGGWAQGGGHSVLSPVYGLGIDRIVQFKVVTPDSVFRIANACQNQDLFWALRGGGGGTFGVVFESTHMVEKQIRLAVVSINFPQTKSNALPFLQLLVDNAVAWGQQGWGGHLGAHNIINVTPLLSLSEAQISVNSVSEYALSQNGTATVETLSSWYAFYDKYVLPNQAPVGRGRILVSRLIPITLFSNSPGRAKIMSYFAHLIDLGQVPYIPLVTPYLYPYIEGSTSATPAWRNSLWHLATGFTWAWNSTVEEKRSIVSKAKDLDTVLESLAPGSGSYVNEANPWMEDWREAFWGINYGRLIDVKTKYDPSGLLECWKCVGFEEGKGQGGRFGCLEGLNS